MCPSSGNIVAMASVLVQAATIVKGLGKTVRSPLSSLSRHQYKTTATFVFNMDSKQYYLIDKEPLLEEDPYRYCNEILNSFFFLSFFLEYVLLILFLFLVFLLTVIAFLMTLNVTFIY